MEIQTTHASDGVKALADAVDERYEDATVLIDNVSERTVLLISINGDDKNAVAKTAMAIAETVGTHLRDHHSELDGQESVELLQSNDDQSYYEYEVSVLFTNVN